MDNIASGDLRRYVNMVALHRGWAGWQSARVEVLLTALELIRAGELSVVNVCQALEISESTWYRNVQALRPVAGSETETECAREIEAALTGAGVVLDENTTLDELKAQIAANPTAELALAGLGIIRNT